MQMTPPSETLAVKWDFAIIPSGLSKTVKPPRFGAFNVSVVEYRVKVRVVSLSLRLLEIFQRIITLCLH